MGYKLAEDVIDNIATYCSFENMKANPMTNPDTLNILVYNKKTPVIKTGNGEAVEEHNTDETSSFMRKGRNKNKDKTTTKVSNGRLKNPTPG